MKAWIANHTGLPSFAFTAPKDSWHVIKAQDVTGRAWEAVAVRGTGLLQVLSDPLALPGVEVTYRVRPKGYVPPSVAPVTLTRPVTDWWRGLVSRLDGRAIPDVAWIKNGDGRSWDSGIQRFNGRLARWPMESEPVKGAGVFVLFDPSKAPDMWALLRRHEPLLIVPGQMADGLPARVVTVDSVASTRLTGDGWLQFSVDWTEVPLDSPMVRRTDGSAGVGTVTWGEWDALDQGWKNRTYGDLCREIAGMP